MESTEPPPNTAVRYTPTELPDLRLRMAQFWTKPTNHEWIYTLHEVENRTATVLREEAPLVRDSITHGELFYVESAIMSIAEADLSPVENYGFMPWDLPTPAGFMYLNDTPRDDEPDLPPIVATWIQRDPDDHDCPNGGVELYLHGNKDEVAYALYGSVDDGSPFDREHADYVLMASIFQPFTEVGTQSWLYTEQGRSAATFGRVFINLCYLMRQRLAQPTTHIPHRAVRRRHQRAGYEPPEVRTVVLHQSQHTETAGESITEWHHRWIVRGHWRKQWYPSIQAHRPIWIMPFMKGPQDAPLLGGEKVYTAHRRDQS